MAVKALPEKSRLRKVPSVLVLHVPLMPFGKTLIEPEEQRRELVEAVGGTLRTAGLAAEERVLEAGPHVPDRIVAAADGWGADLLVVGSRGLKGLRALLGHSVSMDVRRATARPVLVVRDLRRR